MSTEDKKQLKKYGKIAGFSTLTYLLISRVLDLIHPNTMSWSSEVGMALSMGVTMAAVFYYQDKHPSSDSTSDSDKTGE
jgi:hypothetical protein